MCNFLVSMDLGQYFVALVAVRTGQEELPALMARSQVYLTSKPDNAW